VGVLAVYCKNVQNMRSVEGDSVGFMENIVKQVLILCGKSTIALGILYWLVRNDYLDLRLLMNISWSVRTVGILAGAVSLIIVAILLLSWRLHYLLQQQSVYVSVREATSFTLIGALFGSILPGLISGDIIKAIYLCGSATNQRSKSVSVVIIDRIIGMYSLILLGGIASMASQLSAISAAPAGLLMVLSGSALAATVGLFAMILITKTELYFRITKMLPRRLGNLVSAFAMSCRCSRVILVAICISLISHGMVVLCFYAMALLLGDALTLTTHFVVNPLAMAMNVIPLTPGGIGITEGAFAYLYNWCGSQQGAAIGLMGRLVQYFVFSVGGIAAILSIRLNIRNLVTASLTDN